MRYEYNALTHKQNARTVQLFSNEHYLTRLLQTRGKYVSKGFLFVLVDFIFDRLLTENFVDLSITPPPPIEKPKTVDPETQPNTLTGE